MKKIPTLTVTLFLFFVGGAFALETNIFQEVKQTLMASQVIRETDVHVHIQSLIQPGKLKELLKYIEDNDIDVRSYTSPHHSSEKIDYKFAGEKNFIHLAVRYGNRELLDWLMNKGIDINASDSIREGVHTALFFAAEENNIEFASLLLEHGASVSDEDILAFAAQGNLDGVKLLLGFRNAPDNLLHMVALFGHEVLLAALINPPYNLSVNQKTVDEQIIPLHYARNERIAQILIDNGSSVNNIDDIGQTPLLKAASFCHTETYKLLSVIPDALASSIDVEGNTALHLAAAAGFRYTPCNDLLDYIVKSGIDVNAKNYKGEEAIIALACNYRLATFLKDVYKSHFIYLASIHDINPESLNKAYECMKKFGLVKEFELDQIKFVEKVNISHEDL